MTSADRSDAPDDMPALYEIRVRGAFDEKWRGLVEGMTLEVVHEEAQPLTVIRVVVQDQAALAGLLDTLFGLNARVLSVAAVKTAQASLPGTKTPGASPKTKAREDMSVHESLGPIQFIVLGFPGNKFKGEIIPALGDLVKAGTIRVMDLAFVKKDADGSVLIMELEDLADDEAAPFGAFEKQIGDLLNEEDLLAAAAALEPGSSAAALIWENVWARKFADAVRGADGILMAWDHIPFEAVEAVMAAAKKPAE